MRRFRNPFARLERLAARAERNARLELARALAELRDLRAKKQRVEAALAGAERQLCERAPWHTMVEAYAAALARRLHALALAKTRADAVVNGRRDAWRAANRRFESLRRLGALRRDAWRREAEHRQQLELEELAALARRPAGGRVDG